MKPAHWIIVPLVAVGCIVAATSDAQPYTVYSPQTTFASPGACQTCPPPVPPPVVVQPAPRRCCLFRLCDWICGRPAPQTTIAAMPIVPVQPQVTCMPTCAPTCAPACSTCPTCPSSGGVTTMPAPSLSSYQAAPSTYAASAPQTYRASYPVQQAGYTQPATTYSQPATYTQPAGYAAPTSTARPVNYTQPPANYTAPTATVRPISYTTPATQQSYSRRAPSHAAMQWSAGR